LQPVPIIIKTLVIGIDAACLSIIEPLISEGTVPSIATQYEQGIVSELKSQVPPWTASAWSSLYTGMNPGKHGVYDFLTYDGYDWSLVNSTSVAQRAVWEYVDINGFASVVVNVPVTNPPGDIDGAVIPGYLAPEEPDVHPPGILDDVRDEVGDYPIYAEEETNQTRNEQSKYNEYLELTRLRGQTFRYLVNRFDPKFGFVQFQKTDAVFHDFPGDEEKVKGIYRDVDTQIGKVLCDINPDLVMIVSDHGIGRYNGYNFHVNKYLQSGGYVQSTTDGRGVPSWVKLKNEELIREKDFKRATLKLVAHLAKSIGITHQRGKRILEKFGLVNFFRRHIPMGVVYAASEVIDYENSIAYYRSPSELGIRINLKGREPSGQVPPDEYHTVREELISYLAEARTPDNQPVFEEVATREEYYEGDHAPEAADIVLVPSDYQHSLSGILDNMFTDPEPYNHKPDGIMIASGPQVDPSTSIEDPHLFHITPTALASMNIPVNNDMDGRILPFVHEVSRKSYSDYSGPETVGTHDDELEQRLSDLGYLE
jgi:predicted AlkP superfamily phosphohydrolase/phosphomutase